MCARPDNRTSQKLEPEHVLAQEQVVVVVVEDVAGGPELRECADVRTVVAKETVPAQASRAEEGRRIRTRARSAEINAVDGGIICGAVPQQDHKSGVVY